MIKAIFEKFSDNCFILKTEQKDVIKPLTKKQALKTINNKEAFLTNGQVFMYNPGIKSASSEQKLKDRLQKLYQEPIQYYDKKRTVASAVKVSNVTEKHLGVKTHKITKKAGADGTHFKAYEMLDNPEYEYILIGSFLGAKVELRVAKDVFFDVSAPITKVFKLNGM